ncbi:hypothetical protein LCGC14_2519090, partial [marine sediment metagenome]
MTEGRRALEDTVLTMSDPALESALAESDLVLALAEGMDRDDDGSRAEKHRTASSTYRRELDL